MLQLLHCVSITGAVVSHPCQIQSLAFDQQLKLSAKAELCQDFFVAFSLLVRNIAPSYRLLASSKNLLNDRIGIGSNKQIHVWLDIGMFYDSLSFYKDSTAAIFSVSCSMEFCNGL